MVWTWTHTIGMNSWYIHGLTVKTWTHGTDNSHGLRLMDGIASVLPNDMSLIERAECCPDAGFLGICANICICQEIQCLKFAEF